MWYPAVEALSGAADREHGGFDFRRVRAHHSTRLVLKSRRQSTWVLARRPDNRDARLDRGLRTRARCPLSGGEAHAVTQTEALIASIPGSGAPAVIPPWTNRQLPILRRMNSLEAVLKN